MKISRIFKNFTTQTDVFSNYAYLLGLCMNVCCILTYIYVITYKDVIHYYIKRVHEHINECVFNFISSPKIKYEVKHLLTVFTVILLPKIFTL